MTLSGLDIVVLLVMLGAGVLGFVRGFVTEVLALLAWVLVVLVIKLFHPAVAEVLAGWVGTAQGGSVLALALLGGGVYFGGRMIARAIGARTRDSFLGPVDRALGLGFGLLKGLILVSIAFLMLVLVFDTVGGGPAKRPKWISGSTTYPLLNATSAGIADVVDRRRKGLPVFGDQEPDNAAQQNAAN